MGKPFDIDTALAELAEDVAKASPRPDADLVARVLADAAKVTAELETAPPVERRTKTAGFDFRQFLFGWSAGVTAAAALALVLGIGLGMQIGTDLPMMSGGDQPEPAFFSAEAGLLPDDFL